jgi:predicted dehydrogenase
MQALKTDGPVKLWTVADIFPDRIGRCLNALTQGQESRYDREKHKGFSSEIDVPPERRFVGFDAYQKAIDSGVDVVILAMPPVFRPQQYAAAVEAGKHVFMEKPVCVDAPGYRQIVENKKSR